MLFFKGYYVAALEHGDNSANIRNIYISGKYKFFNFLTKKIINVFYEFFLNENIKRMMLTSPEAEVSWRSMETLPKGKHVNI